MSDRIGQIQRQVMRAFIVSNGDRFVWAICCRAAIELNPNVAAAHSNLGIALIDLKRPAEALASYDKALKPEKQVRK
jgi:tetratricopeptide (TPR) repeat protein